MVPVLLLTAAFLPWPYGYFGVLRLVVFGACVFLAYREYSAASTLGGWAFTLGVTALFFNPLLPVHFARAIWITIDLAVTGLLVFHLVKRRSAVS
jgi:Family of unknown function (DUF6804)